MSFRERRLARLLLTATLITLLILYLSPATSFRAPQANWSDLSVLLTCPPERYNAGSWVYNPRTNRSSMDSPDDALLFSGLEGCASSREYYWHLAANRQDQWDRFPGAQSWEWLPSRSCRMRSWNPESFIRDLILKGGWLLIGDSVTENHFFSLSCLLYPHILATPDYTRTQSFDRAWPQNLYLNPSSPILSRLKLPKSFDITSTPLVTFRRVDLLFSQEELRTIYHESLPPNHHHSTDTDEEIISDDPEDALFSDEQVWTLPITSYLSEFLSTSPTTRYSTMIVSTGGHWTTTLFNAEPNSIGIDSVLSLFETAMNQWTERVQRSIDEWNDRPEFKCSRFFSSSSCSWAEKEGWRKKEVVVRPYLPGHEDCHSFTQPWEDVQPFIWNWYNWAEIGRFNGIFEKLLSTGNAPNVHFLPIDRPARLRPDAHATGDCLHIMTGAGVLEGWTHYIWHYITKEL